ncbi:NAD-dependent epimerase/dehydratase family protein [Ginsengibacter hankyongi]|uniref:NAD-dependent epimerase/dehydratase family protein n=1 Tax=Ginsengibacter hankyongi TaxID=2607284 RepID=UPI001F33857A|nr:GDP-mannose 4,6-dehydratase [Ginsengibacter hankyongi]
MNERILITGSKGFVGNSLTSLLKSKSFEVFDVGSSNTLNLCDWEAVKNIPKSEIIVHLASKSFVPDSFKTPLSFYNNNILSTLNILEKAKIDGAKVIFFSTYVYGTPIYLPIDENHHKSPKNPYTQSKLIGEELCEAYFRDFGVPVTIFRPFNIYGAGQKFPFFIPTVISQINNKAIQLNDSRPKRDFIYIDDVVEAVHLSIIDNDKFFRIYNLGSGVSTSIKDIVDAIINLSQSKARVHFTNEIRQGEILDTIADISKIQNELNWKPKISITRGLRLTIEYFKKNRDT